MNDDSINRIEGLERRVAVLSQSLRLMVGMLVCASAVRSSVVMLRVPQYKEMFADLLGGTTLPFSTAFFLAYSTPIFGAVWVLSAAALLSLMFLSDRAWAIPFSVVLVAFCITITESASYALMQPFISIGMSLGH